MLRFQGKILKLILTNQTDWRITLSGFCSNNVFNFAQKKWLYKNMIDFRWLEKCIHRKQKFTFLIRQKGLDLAFNIDRFYL